MGSQSRSAFGTPAAPVLTAAVTRLPEGVPGTVTIGRFTTVTNHFDAGIR
ncbi:hypothetical protein OG824_27830 [Streptomyces prunicolor]|nr:hypothetical protein [Streptomyces prunicolor]MCX5239014.1 hypothetical protein [Streptomyces prunicolor]